MSVIYSKTSREADRLQEKNLDLVYCTHEKYYECNAVGSWDDMLMDPSDFLSDFYCPRHAKKHYITANEWYHLANEGKIHE